MQFENKSFDSALRRRFYYSGSQAKGTATAKSDIDLCVIASTKDKRSLLTDLYCDTESDTPIDFLLYTPEEWEHSVADSQSFANKLNREGVVLYG